MDQQDAQPELPVVQQDWGSVGHDGAVHLSNLPLAQPLEQPMPNLMPAITALIMQITTHLSQPNGNPQMAMTFQPLVNLALNMQIQAWQQVSAAAAAHQLPMVMEQMHMVAQQQATPSLAMESNVPAGTAQHPAEAVSVAAAAPLGLPQDTSASGQPLEQQELSAQNAPQGPVPAQQEAQHDTQPQPTPLEAAALQHQALAAQQALAMQAAQATAAAIAAAASQQQQQRAQLDASPADEAPEENGESDEEGDEGGDNDDDDDYPAKGGRADARQRGGRQRGSGGGARPQRARKRSKMLQEYLTDEEEGEGGRGSKQRRTHLD